jgi:hypothetical protein
LLWILYSQLICTPTTTKAKATHPIKSRITKMRANDALRIKKGLTT